MCRTKSVAIFYGIVHFLVDFCCAFFMFSIAVQMTDFYIGYLIYNFLAFALQMPAGLIADRIKENRITAALGCLFVFAALFTLWLCQGCETILWAGLGMAGIGNCLFHVGGGIEVMKISGRRAAPLGIFVSPGAIGIFLGTVIAGGKRVFPILFTLLLLGVVIGLLVSGKVKAVPTGKKVSAERNVPTGINVEEKTKAPRYGMHSTYVVAGAVACFFLVVVLRSYLGMAASFPWKDTVTEGVIVLSAVFGGKLAGGFAADKWGVTRTAMVSLSAAALLFLFSGYMWGGLPALFFFNMSMPITLYLAAKTLDGQNGFAFGILTFAIFIGFLPAYAGIGSCNGPVLSGMTLASLILLYLGIRGSKKEAEGNE